MKRKFLSATLALLMTTSGVAASFGEGPKERSAFGWNDESGHIQGDLALGIGNYRQLESGQNPVVISPSKEESRTIVPGLSTGYLSNAATDNTAIQYRLGAPVLTNPTPIIVWYGSWNQTPVAVNPITVSGIGSAIATYGAGSRSMTVSSPSGLIAVGQNVVGSGIPSNTLVTQVNGTTVSISQATTSKSPASNGVIFKSSATPTTLGDYYLFNNDLLSGLASSSRWSSIMSGYYSRSRGAGTIKSNIGPLNFSPSRNFFVPSNTSLYGSVLSQSSILKIAQTVSNPPAGAIVLVIPSADIPVTGFNSGTVQFCGWHSWSGTVAYGFVGDSAATRWCQGQPAPTPSGNVGADSMASVLVHEIEEAVTDPQINAWYSSNGNENADKCAWSWGSFLTTSTVPIYSYNYSWGSRKFLIQQEFRLNLSSISSTSTTDTVSGSCGL